MVQTELMIVFVVIGAVIAFIRVFTLTSSGAFEATYGKREEVRPF